MDLVSLFIAIPLVLFSCWAVVDWIWRPWSLLRLCRKQNIKGFPFVPLVGQLPQICKMLRCRAQGSGVYWNGVKELSDCIRKYGKVFSFVTGRTVRICVADPVLIKDILQTNAHCYSKPQYIENLEILRTGIFATSGESWARQRKLLQLQFVAKEVKDKIPVITEFSHDALATWLGQSDSGELRVHEKLSELTFRVVKALGFGEILRTSANEISSKVVKSFSRYLLNCRRLFFGLPAGIPAYRFLPTQLNEKIFEDEIFLSKFMDDLIMARTSECATTSSEVQDARNDVLDVLLSSSTREISSEQVRDNGLTILLAGHHTSASLLSWSMYLLALYPLWQERARTEVEEFCSDGKVEWNTLSDLKTLTMILNEALRLFPPIPLIGRKCVKENLVGSYVIPPGVEIMIPTAAVHRDKDQWGEDAEEFLPMRFANGLSKASKHVLGYLPFGSGPRTCVGQTLALAEAKTVLAALLPLISWSLSPGYLHCPEVSLALQPKFDIPVDIRRLK